MSFDVIAYGGEQSVLPGRFVDMPILLNQGLERWTLLLSQDRSSLSTPVSSI